MKAFLILSLWGLFTHNALAETCEVPNYSEKEWAFIRALDATSPSPVEWFAALATACGELDKATDRGAFALSTRTIKAKFLTLAWMPFESLGYGTAAFTNLNKNDVQERFRSELDLIKVIPEPRSRIAKVYELVSKYQGKYGPGGKPIRIPTQVLNKASIDGSGGECRDFALLLYWSLMQVAKFQMDNGSGMGELNLNSFSMEAVYGNVTSSGPLNGSHQWVRVNLPVKTAANKMLQFEQFDLDTTFYPGKFTPLSPRQQGISDVLAKERKDKCLQIQKCKFQQSLEKNIKALMSDRKPENPCASP